MQLQDITYLLQHPQEFTPEQLNDITAVIKEYPYFQAARALHLKGLKHTESFRYNQELKTTAAYTTDRSILFDYITSEAFNQNEISLQIKHNSEHIKQLDVHEESDISINKSVLIDDALKQHIKDTEGVLDPFLFEEKRNGKDFEDNHSNTSEEKGLPIIAIDTENIEQTPEEQLQIGKPLDFEKNETHSFSEWLKITSFKPIERNDFEEEKETTPELQSTQEDPEPKPKSRPMDSKLDLIDKFLSSNPKIVPSKEAPPSPKLNTSKDDNQNDGLMTETLARIYLEQKNYDKAIQSYKILSLKYPEKSGFFADQIKAVKKLQENNTKE
ncbi:hypothetical protein [Mangrovimonas sp. YM274]|uniref:hypothetical protein n=1 Tax=Mangrovimonas sp. YM274 TaxID=3070660 RepID=UPI0027DE1135|nr:hypothetical protein [Mangrovimonas sp. YM274]WMI68283.1 hypothetical protein RBH95_14175 [Mangrovimonas sp. YM274]